MRLPPARRDCWALVLLGLLVPQACEPQVIESLSAVSGLPGGSEIRDLPFLFAASISCFLLRLLLSLLSKRLQLSKRKTA